MSSPSFDPTVLLRSEQSDGHLSAIEVDVPPGWPGPPLHRHDFDETFYVLAGELTFELDGARRTAGTGELVFAPGNVAHGFANFTDAPARYLLICTPAGFERYFGRIEAERRGAEPPVWAQAEIPPVETLGPPIERLDG
jgi:quercetin dioxygenase-like cupin family protein